MGKQHVASASAMVPDEDSDDDATEHAHTLTQLRTDGVHPRNYPNDHCLFISGVGERSIVPEEQILNIIRDKIFRKKGIIRRGDSGALDPLWVRRMPVDSAATHGQKYRVSFATPQAASRILARFTNLPQQQQGYLWITECKEDALMAKKKRIQAAERLAHEIDHDLEDTPAATPSPAANNAPPAAAAAASAPTAPVKKELSSHTIDEAQTAMQASRTRLREDPEQDAENNSQIGRLTTMVESLVHRQTQSYSVMGPPPQQLVAPPVVYSYPSYTVPHHPPTYQSIPIQHTMVQPMVQPHPPVAYSQQPYIAHQQQYQPQNQYHAYGPPSVPTMYAAHPPQQYAGPPPTSVQPSWQPVPANQSSIPAGAYYVQHSAGGYQHSPYYTTGAPQQHQ
jgi:hypothetical protein